MAEVGTLAIDDLNVKVIHNRMCNPCRGQSEALGDEQRPYIASGRRSA